MWIFVSHLDATYDVFKEDYGYNPPLEMVEVTHGQFLYLHNHKDVFWTYDRARREWSQIALWQYSGGATAYFKETGGSDIPVKRLDYQNCQEWGWCADIYEGGSYNSLRGESVGVYKNTSGDTNYPNLEYMFSMSDTEREFVIAVGYGYTPGLDTDLNMTDRCRVWGYRDSVGNYHEFGFEAYIDLDPTQHPLNYGINTY